MKAGFWTAPSAFSDFLETRKPSAPFGGESLDNNFHTVKKKYLLDSSKASIYSRCIAAGQVQLAFHKHSRHLHNDTHARALTRTCTVVCELNGDCYWLQYIGFTLLRDGFWGAAAPRFNCKGSCPSGASRHQGSSAVSHLLLRMDKGKLMWEVHTHTCTQTHTGQMHLSYEFLWPVFDVSWLPCTNIFTVPFFFPWTKMLYHIERMRVSSNHRFCILTEAHIPTSHNSPICSHFCILRGWCWGGGTVLSEADKC